MNKLIIALLACCTIAFASCKKSDSTSEIYKPSYHVDGIADRVMQKSTSGIAASAVIYLTVSYENLDQERVSLSLEGAPAGLVAKFLPATGFPTFTSTLQLVDSGVAAGDYTLKLVATGATSGKRSFDFNLSVLAAPDCASFVTGTNYTSQTTCGTGTFTQNITAVAGTPGRITFSNFDGTGTQIYGIINCSGGQITVPTQTVNNVVYSGSGSYQLQTGGQQHAIYVSFTRTNAASGTISCTLYMSN